MLKKVLLVLEGACLLMVGVFIGVLLSFGKLEKQYTSSPPIELQHELMTLGDDWYYCPYCGERLHTNHVEDYKEQHA